MLVWQAHKATAKVRALAFSPAGRYIATAAGESRLVWLWDATSGKLVHELKSIVVRPARAVAFLPDGKHVVAFYGSRGGAVWDVETADVVALLRTNAMQRHPSIAVRPDGKQLLYPVTLGMAVWDDPAREAEYGRKYDRLRSSNFRQFWPVWIGYSPAGKYLCRANGNVCLLDADTHRPRRVFEMVGCAASTPVAFSADETRMGVGFGHRAVVWRLDKPKAEPLELVGHGAQVRAVGFLPNGNVLTAGMDGTARVWDSDTGTELRSFDWGIGKVRIAAVSPDGLTCAAAGENGQVVVWDVDA